MKRNTPPRHSRGGPSSQSTTRRAAAGRIAPLDPPLSGGQGQAPAPKAGTNNAPPKLPKLPKSAPPTKGKDYTPRAKPPRGSETREGV